MYLPNSLPRQPFLDDCWVFLAKLLQISDGFLAFPKMIRLVVNILEFFKYAKAWLKILIKNWDAKSCFHAFIL